MNSLGPKPLLRLLWFFESSGSALAAMLSPALGVGANTSIVSVIDALLLRASSTGDSLEPLSRPNIAQDWFFHDAISLTSRAANAVPKALPFAVSGVENLIGSPSRNESNLSTYRSRRVRRQWTSDPR